MPRAIWSGSISFGLVNIPVKLYSAARRKKVSFNLLDPEEKVRVKQQYVRPGDDEEFERGELVRGFEVGPDQYVVIEPEELEALQPETSRTIDIQDFVELSDIDPVYFDRPYYLGPDESAAKPYRLLVEAMRDSSRVGIAKFVMRNKEYLAAIRAVDEGLVLETMRFHDEIVPMETIGGLPDASVEVTDKEREVAQQLIDSLTTEFEPEAYEDTYREAVLEMIKRKAEGEEIVTQPAAEEEPGKVIDLMAALEESLEQAKSRKKSA